MNEMRCAQCQWGLGNEPVMAMLVQCPDCGGNHTIWVHLIICLDDFNEGASVRRSQCRRAGYWRLN